MTRTRSIRRWRGRMASSTSRHQPRGYSPKVSAQSYRVIDCHGVEDDDADVGIQGAGARSSRRCGRTLFPGREGRKGGRGFVGLGGRLRVSGGARRGTDPSPTRAYTTGLERADASKCAGRGARVGEGQLDDERQLALVIVGAVGGRNGEVGRHQEGRSTRRFEGQDATEG